MNPTLATLNKRLSKFIDGGPLRIDGDPLRIDGKARAYGIFDTVGWLIIFVVDGG